MKTVTFLALCIALPIVYSASAVAAGRQACPTGYSQLVGVCIHDRTGDVVSIATEKGAKGQTQADAQPAKN